MTQLILALALTMIIAVPGQSRASGLVGDWIFYKVIYQGEERPPFSPNLQLTFTFFEDGTDILRYTRANEEGFCERKGEYTYQKGILNDEVIWVNPANNSDCSLDPDMQKGNVTKTKVEIVNGDLHLYLTLSGEPLIYVWKRVGLDSL